MASVVRPLRVLAVWKRQEATSAGAWTVSACLSKADMRQPRWRVCPAMGRQGPVESATLRGDRATARLKRIYQFAFCALFSCKPRMSACVA